MIEADEANWPYIRLNKLIIVCNPRVYGTKSVRNGLLKLEQHTWKYQFLMIFFINGAMLSSGMFLWLVYVCVCICVYVCWNEIKLVKNDIMALHRQIPTFTAKQGIGTFLSGFWIPSFLH